MHTRSSPLQDKKQAAEERGQKVEEQTESGSHQHVKTNMILLALSSDFLQVLPELRIRTVDVLKCDSTTITMTNVWRLCEGQEEIFHALPAGLFPSFPTGWTTGSGCCEKEVQLCFVSAVTYTKI